VLEDEQDAMGTVVAACTYPDIEVEILVVDRLDIEAYCRNGGYDFANLSDNTG
jgi:hypothetical protein